MPAEVARRLPSGLRLRRWREASGLGQGYGAVFVLTGCAQVSGLRLQAGQCWRGHAPVAEPADDEAWEVLVIDGLRVAEGFEDGVLEVDAESAISLLRLLALLPQPEPAAALACHFEAMRLLTAPGRAELASAPDAPDARVLRAAEQLRAQMAKPPSLEALAREVGLSPSALKRGFAAVFGGPPYAWLRAERLLEARRLITHTDRPIADIASSVGLAAGGHFAAACQRAFGLEPRALRQAAKADRGLD